MRSSKTISKQKKTLKDISKSFFEKLDFVLLNLMKILWSVLWQLNIESTFGRIFKRCEISLQNNSDKKKEIITIKKKEILKFGCQLGMFLLSN